MQSEGIGWSDIGNVIEAGFKGYTEAEVQEYGQVKRAEGVEAGIKIGLARVSNGNGSGNGSLTLPKPFEMAEYCRRHRDDLEPKHHSFVDKMPTRTRSGRPLSPKETGYLASLYIQLGGKV